MFLILKGLIHDNFIEKMFLEYYRVSFLFLDITINIIEIATRQPVTILLTSYLKNIL